ncbi:MAG: iron ABC transporter permease [Gammaproteobacteria bacterium]|nr:iron ABC transporter permease [Gammaproteobacteria bacterium]MBU1554873.1 iron ABC transporter permease [Gammaproteobacteria bacterium]MBU2070986.1 iron ABC transporter permease [Gammaproteobacteria bacterium]MBU2183812.1 iron ABC transporter permease [Gammaproteobacteria bacterium]MBU2206489.1 iron ABC transporter permease [Gammaproteobacteria bacterium]
MKSGWTDIWRWAVLLPAAVLALPVLMIFASLLSPQTEIWLHLRQTVLADYVTNSLLLAFGTGAGALAVGTGTAWLITQYQFVGRRYLEWLLLLPLAMPAYIIAYTYTGMLDFAGPVQSLLRELTGWRYGDYWFPQIRSLGGAILMLTLVLYPYVYMLARTAFREQSSSLLEASRTLGLTPRQHFWQVALPLARPAIITGTALAMMEAFADYGTVQYFGVPTFTTGIFRTWFGMGSQAAAAQLAALLTGFVLALLLLEQWSRRKIRYYHQGQRPHSAARRKPGRPKQWLFFTLCLLPLLFGFLIPAMQLLSWALSNYQVSLNSQFTGLVWNSFKLAAMAALISVGLALLFGYGQRLRQDILVRAPVRVAALGYAVPGTVIAIGVMLPLAWLDGQIDLLAERWFGLRTGLIFSGTLFALVLAYSVRFLAVSLHSVEAGLQRIKPSMDNAARSLGYSPAQVLRKVHVPLLRSSVLTALLLVFVDVLKELPATLLLRPFNFNTLAVRTYELASDERLADAALPALAIVLVSLLPVILLARSVESPEKGPT